MSHKLLCGCCPAGSQIIYAFIMMPHTLPQSYVRWIRKQGAKELYVWQGVRVRTDWGAERNLVTIACCNQLQGSRLAMVSVLCMQAISHHCLPQLQEWDSFCCFGWLAVR